MSIHDEKSGKKLSVSMEWPSLFSRLEGRVNSFLSYPVTPSGYIYQPETNAFSSQNIEVRRTVVRALPENTDSGERWSRGVPTSSFWDSMTLDMSFIRLSASKKAKLNNRRSPVSH
jgi:hypothetical protein